MKQFIKCPKCGSIQLQDFEKTGLQHLCTVCNNWLLSDEIPVPLKALSYQQPWAWLITSKMKDIENRSWKTKFIGTHLVHAAKKFDNEGWIWLKDCIRKGQFSELVRSDFYKMHIEDYQRGGIVGYADITNCVQKSDSPWFFGPSGFVLKNAGTLPFTPCKGKLSFFKPEID